MRLRLSQGWMAAAAAAVTLFCLTQPIAAQADSVDWVQSFENEGHNGLNHQEKTLSPANVGQLQLAWAKSLGGSVRTFLLNDHNIVARVTSEDGQSVNLIDLDAASGASIWAINTGRDVEGAYSTLATGKHRAFSECGFVDKYGYDYSGICAYKKDSGKPAWSFSNPCDCSPEARVTSPLVYSRGIVFFGYFNGGSEGRDYVLAARAGTGEILGAYQTGGFTSLGSASVIHGIGTGLMYFDCGGSVCAVLHRQGTLKWQTPMGAAIGALSADNNRHVYANLCNGSAGLIALDGTTGAPLWSYGTPECNKAPAAVAGNTVYFTGADQRVHALDAQTGAELWSTAPGTASSVSIANGVLYADGAPGAPGASAYDASNGTLLWSTPPQGSDFYPPPVIIDGSVYVANGACGSICAYGLPGPRRR